MDEARLTKVAFAVKNSRFHSTEYSWFYFEPFFRADDATLDPSFLQKKQRYHERYNRLSHYKRDH